MRRHERVTVRRVAQGFLAYRVDRFGRELATEAASSEALATTTEDRNSAADRRGNRCHDLLQAALFEDQALQSPLHGDATLQHLVLLIDQAREGLLGDRDEGRRVRHLEERKVAFLRL